MVDMVPTEKSTICTARRKGIWNKNNYTVHMNQRGREMSFYKYGSKLMNRKQQVVGQQLGGGDGSGFVNGQQLPMRELAWQPTIECMHQPAVAVLGCRLQRSWSSDSMLLQQVAVPVSGC